MDKTKARSVINNLLKEGTTPEEIHEDKVKTLMTALHIPPQRNDC
jgi:hypothetical protein